MRIPRDLSASELITLLRKFSYEVTRQKGSHIRLTTTINGEHHLTIPNHNPLKLGTLASILNEVAMHLRLSKEEVFRVLFG